MPLLPNNYISTIRFLAEATIAISILCFVILFRTYIPLNRLHHISNHSHQRIIQSGSFLSRPHSTFLYSKPESPFAYLKSAKNEPEEKIRTWQPSTDCTGSFVSKSFAKDLKYNDSIPYAMIRDANVDYTKIIRSQSNQLLHISIYVTVHLSAKMIQHPATVTSTSLGTIDRIEQIDRFLNVLHKPYKLGDVNRRGYSVSEWRVNLSLNSSDISGDSLLNLSLPLKTYDGLIIKFRPWMHLSCINGVRNAPPFENTSKRSWTCLKSTQAVLFGGKAIFGADYPSLAKKLAHFAARATFGQMKFTSVIMAINVPHSRTALTKKGTPEDTNWGNKAYLTMISALVKQELVKIGVWDKFPTNGLIIVPACTLGTATKMGNEKCSLSSRYGQYSTGLMLHSLFSQSFRWSVSLDMDEFIYEDARNEVKSEDALVDTLDRIDANQKYRGYFTFKWFNFLLPSDSLSELTNDVLQDSSMRILGRAGSKYRNLGKKQCMSLKLDLKGRVSDVTGKSALRCDVGEGYKVHTSVIRNGSTGKLRYPGKLLDKSTIRIWHARHKSAGACMYNNSMTKISTDDVTDKS